MMNSTEREWFNELTQKRKNSIEVYKEDGIIDIVIGLIVDTYRDSAHFIYELLQNADDVSATKVKFDLRKDGVVFAHDGRINFSISDPKNERKPGVISGHINAITTFSLSPKKEDIENKIGKFGIGFKSVFQYTDTPHIYNHPYSFRIEHFMIPYEVAFDNSLIEKEMTTFFWLPFDKKEKTPSDAYKEISAKLGELKNPLLFLRNLNSIQILNEGKSTIFSRKITPIKQITLPSIELYEVKLDTDTILRFDSRVNIRSEKGSTYHLPISIGFPVEGKHISANEKFKHYTQYSWCFFPTRQETNLNYIINAPFILTPNREALKEDRTENGQLINELAQMMGSAIQGLKELGYISEEFFATIPMPSKMPQEFRQIGEKLIGKLKNGEFIPTRDGKHISVSNAFVCTEPLLADLLNFDKGLPLRKLTKKPNASLVFPERKLFADQNLFVFFYQQLSAAQTDLTATWLGGQYTNELIIGMPDAFVTMFFKYLAERSNSILARAQPLWSKPFIPVHNGSDEITIVKPNNTSGEPQVFIGGTKLAGRNVVVDYLANDPEVRPFLLTTLNFRIPNEFDDFYLSLKKYEKENHTVDFEEGVKDFFIALQYFSNDATRVNSQKLLKRLKELDFVIALSNEQKYSFENPSQSILYYPNKELKKYFENTDSAILWVAIDKYLKENISTDEIKSFLVQLGVEFIPYYWQQHKNGTQNVLQGIHDFMQNISLDSSIYLIEVLNLRNATYTHELGFLKTTAWLFDENGVKKMPSEIYAGKLHKQYPLYANSIHIALGVFTEKIDDRYAGLKEEEKEILQAIIPSLGQLTPEEIKLVLAEYLKKKKAENRSDNKPSDNKGADVENSEDKTTPQGLIDSWINDPVRNNTKKMEEDILKGNTIPLIPNSIDFWGGDEDLDSTGIDNPGGYVAPPVIGKNYRDEKESKKKRQMEKEIELETKRNKLLELASQFEPYSFGWFKTLLELEDNFTSEERVKRSPVHVVFNKAAVDTDGILVLSDTVYIPPTIEEIGGLSIQLIFGDDKKTIAGEVVSPKKQMLLIKLSNPDQIQGIDFETVSHVVVEASSPDFILERLKTAFARLNFEDTDNLKSKELLPNDLNFVFGPPGTGKTTYLSWLIGGKNAQPLIFANRSITPLMEQEGKKVLVLTPTNKAADVLVQRILKHYVDVNDFPQWLIRFGQSEVLENEPFFVGDRMLKSWIYDKCTLVTTIARFPYDYFKVERGGELDDWSIKDFNWDVIIFDEASMIHQSALLFAVFYARQVNPKVEFFIGGDPFQIPPIIQFEYPYWSYLPEPAIDSDGNPILDNDGRQMAWKQDGGNIYAFIGLMNDESFSRPVTEPHQFPIHNLNRQYRSIVPIGALFSHYRYSGKLSHHRTPEAIASEPLLSEKRIEINGIPLKPITIVRFPVKKNEGVYRVRTIKGSPYQLYSSIFVVELMKYIQTNVKLDKDDIYRIGIVSPYAIQSNIIEKLLNTLVSGTIEVMTGTVHSFQGDECNLVIVVLNPPKNITRSPRTFVNKKNILNVAISRAKDKMIILAPYDPDGELNINDLHQIQWIIKLAQVRPECKNDVAFYEASEIERKILGSDKFIEDNTFPTTHQNVNIYTKAVRLYEIRQDENAIDVLVHPVISK